MVELPRPPHTQLRHEIDGPKVREHILRHGPLAVYAVTGYQTRFIEVCLLDPTTVGFRIVDAKKEITAYIKRDLRGERDLSDYINALVRYGKIQADHHSIGTDPVLVAIDNGAAALVARRDTGEPLTRADMIMILCDQFPIPADRARRAIKRAIRKAAQQ